MNKWRVQRCRCQASRIKHPDDKSRICRLGMSWEVYNPSGELHAIRGSVDEAIQLAYARATNAPASSPLLTELDKRAAKFARYVAGQGYGFVISGETATLVASSSLETRR